MPTSTEKFSHGFEGGKHPARTKVRPKKTVTTVHADGHVTSTGPEAAAATKDAEASVKKVKRVVKATKTEEHNKAVRKKLARNPITPVAKRVLKERKVSGFGPDTYRYEDKGGLDPTDLLDDAKKIVAAAGRQNPGAAPVRNLVEDEGKNLLKVAKENLTGSNAVRQLKGVPNSDELKAAAAITAPVAGDARVAGEAAEAGRSAVSKAAEKASEETANLATRVRTKPARVVQSVKEAPTKAKEIPSDVKRALETPEARKATAKASAKTAARHPIKTGVPAAAILPPGVIPGDASDRARALLTGLARAVEHPGDMATATAHGVLGAFTAPLAVTASAVESAKQGNIGPLTQELGTLAGGVEDLGKKLVSGNPKEVEQTFRKELGFTPLIPAPRLLKNAKESDTVEGAIGSVRGKVEGRRAVKRDALIKDVQKAEKEGSFVSTKIRDKIDKLAPVTDSRTETPYVTKKLGRFKEKQRARHDVSRIVSRTEARGNYAAKGWSQRIAKALKKSKFDTNGEDTVADAQRILNKYGIPLDETGSNFVRMLHESYPELKPGDVPAGVHLDRHSTKWLLDHPDALKDPQVRKAVELFDKQAEKVGTSDRNRYLGVVNSIINPLRKAEGKRPILLPEEQVTKATAGLMDKLVKGRDPHKDPWTRDEVLDYAKELRNLEPDTEAIQQARKRAGASLDAVTQAKKDLEIEKAHLKKGQEMMRDFKSRGLDTSLANFEGRVKDSADRVKSREADLMEAKSAADISSREYSKANRENADAQHELAKKIERSLVDDEGNLLMRSPKHGGAEGGVATTRSVSYTPEMEQRFVEAARSEVKGRGLREPSHYVGDELPDALKGTDKLPSFAAGIPLNKIWPSRGEAAMSGNAFSDFEHFMHKSVEAPRHRASLIQGLDELVQKGSRKIEGKRAVTDDVARRLENEHKVPPGTAWVRIAALKSFIKENPHATSDDIRMAIENELDNGPRLTVTDELAKDVGALEHVKGEKLVPMDAHYINEFLNHMKPIEGVTKIGGDATRFASRMILNSPAFLAIQAAQEGIPLAAALGRDVRHIPTAIKNLKVASKLDPDELAAFKAASGSSSGLFGTPSQAELRADGYLDPVRMTAKPEMWRRAWHLVNGKVLGELDKNRGGYFRELGMEARTIGDLKRASKGFGKWRKSTNNMFKDMEGAAKAMKGMDADERHAYIAEHPELQDRIQKAADGMAGNWNSFTVFEKHFAPLTLFYTFQRYSALWMLYHFPLDHPVAATALTLLGQVNAKQLQKLAAEKGAEPNILDYTMPVYSRGEGNQAAVLPAGKRAFPGLSTIQQSAITGNPAQLVGELPPWLSIPVEAATGKASYTGQDIEENLLAFMGKQALNLNPAVRLFLGLTSKRSAASQAFHEQDPLSQWRSVVDPYIGQSGEQFGKTKRLEKDFSLKYGPGKIPSVLDNKEFQKILYENPDGQVDPRKLQEWLRKNHEQEEASGNVKQAEQEATGESDSGLTESQKEAIKIAEENWKTGPNGGSVASPGSTSTNPFSQAVGKSSGSESSNPFSQALSESSNSTSTNPFSAAVAGG